MRPGNSLEACYVQTHGNALLGNIRRNYGRADITQKLNSQKNSLATKIERILDFFTYYLIA